MGYEEGQPTVFDRNLNGWVRVPDDVKLPDNQQDRDMVVRMLFVKFQMSQAHPMVELMGRIVSFNIINLDSRHMLVL